MTGRIEQLEQVKLNLEPPEFNAKSQTWAAAVTIYIERPGEVIVLGIVSMLLKKECSGPTSIHAGLISQAMMALAQQLEEDQNPPSSTSVFN